MVRELLAEIRFFLCITVFTWVNVCLVSAEKISADKAAAIAADFAQKKMQVTSVSAPRRAMREESSFYASGAGEQECSPLYVFNVGTDEGWVVVAGDDRTVSAVLGYSESGSFDYDSIPENLRWWLGEYELQIQSLSEVSAPAPAPRYVAKEVAPLLSSLWSQSSPYNNNCPSLNGQRSVVGCVATAWGQIAYYHKHPSAASGEYSYEWKKDNNSLRSGTFNSTYDWNLILPEYSSSATDAQRNEVAKLLSDMGNSMHMDYGSSSGAMPDFATGAMAQSFGYDKAMLVKRRKFYDNEDWDNILRSELDAGRPVLYSGWKSKADGGDGHSFVCDGYNENGMFHFNYGWGVKSDAYFVSSAVQDNFNSSQQITVGIKPSVSGSAIGVDGVFTSDFTASVATNALGGATWTFRYSSAPHFSTHTPTKVLTAVCIENLSTGEKVYSGQKSLTASTANDWAWTAAAGSWTYTKALPQGKYASYPVYKADGEEPWHRFYFQPDKLSNALLSVTNTEKSVEGCMVESFSLKEERLRMVPGAMYTLSPIVRPTTLTDVAFAYHSSNESVAKVTENGVVTAVQEGEVIVTVTTTDGSNLHAAVQVLVAKPQVGEEFDYGDFRFKIMDDAPTQLMLVGLTEQGQYKKELQIPSEVISGERFEVTRVASHAIYNNEELTKLTIPTTIQYIDTAAFSLCCRVDTLIYRPVSCGGFITNNMIFNKLGTCSEEGTILMMGSLVQELPDNFMLPAVYPANIPNIQAIEWEENPVCTVIGARSFYYGKGLKRIVVPKYVERIADQAFAACSAIEKIELYPRIAPRVSSKTFQGVSRTTTTVEIECEEVWTTYYVSETTGVWSEFSNIVFRGECEEDPTHNPLVEDTSEVVQIVDISGRTCSTNMDDLMPGVYVLVVRKNGLVVSEKYIKE